VADRTPQPPASRTGPSGPPWHRSRRVNTLNHLSKKYRAVHMPVGAIDNEFFTRATQIPTGIKFLT